jgi:hypothetical protein
MYKNLFFLFYFFYYQAFAQIYFEVGPSLVSYRNTFGSSSIQTNQKIGTVKFGYEFSRSLTAEFMTGVGQLSNSAVYINGAKTSDIDIKFNNAYGVYIKGAQPIYDGVGIFGRIGYASVRGSSSYHELSQKIQEQGASYGTGITFDLDQNKYLSLDYLFFLKNDDMKINSFGIYFGQKF